MGCVWASSTTGGNSNYLSYSMNHANGRDALCRAYGFQLRCLSE
ncbi:hypothetical protein [uncultured Rikenella sp.]|nr:hypothetical protein [uncultured Rikenella sp.]